MDLESLKKALLDEMELPDFKARHFFVAKLRVMIFILCWILFLLFLPRIWTDIPWAGISFNLGFLITSICYYYFLQERLVLPMALLEILSDIVSQTAILYILGIDTNVVFLFYGLYIIATGSFFGYTSALVAATFVLLSYGFLFIIIQGGWLLPYHYPFSISPLVGSQDFGYFFNLVMLPIALGVLVYGSRIAHIFATIKERLLAQRNNQLMALNRMGSSIRFALDLETVQDNVLKGIIQGLGFDTCFLFLNGTTQNDLQLFLPSNHTLSMQLMEEWTSQNLRLPLGTVDNAVIRSIQQSRVVIRYDLFEILRGMIPAIAEERVHEIQEKFAFQKFVVIPLLAERKGLGAIVGVSRKGYIEEEIINSLDHFSNQAALAIESAQLFEELARKNKQLEEAGKVKSDFLAIMSHELRTPLTAIIGYSEILMDQIAGDQEKKRSLQEVLKNSENLLQLINNILDIAKMESGKMERILEEFSLSEIVQDVVQTVHSLVSRKNQILIVSVPPDLPLVLADSQKMRQVLVNLLGNAIKFTPEKGRIEVNAVYETSPEKVRALFPDLKLEALGFFIIKVKDSGIGIKADQLDHLFEIFQQIDSTFTRKYQGTGLGLALSRQLVELHDGKIGVSSEYGRGSEFRFVIPQLIKK